MIENMRRAAILLLAFAAAVHAQTPNWIRFTTPNFDVYTTADENTGRSAAVFFEQVRSFFLKASPVRPTMMFPVRVIAFSGRAEFAPYSPQPQALAFYTSNPRYDYIVLSSISPGSYAVAVHEYMHLIIRHSGLKLPIWLHEGWADVYSTMRSEKNGVAVGDLLADRMAVLEKQQWLDINTLTSVTADSPIYNEGDHTSVFYSESWALAHMLFLSPEYRDNFPKFVTALHRGKSFAEAAQASFGKSPAAVFADLKNYFRRKKLYGVLFDMKLSKAEGDPDLHEVTPFQSQLLLADVSAALGRNDLATRVYQELGKQRPEDPALQESIAYQAISKNDFERARAALEKAYAAGSKDAKMCLLLAFLENAIKQPPEKVIPILRRSLESRPDYTDAAIELGIALSGAREYTESINIMNGISDVEPSRASRFFGVLAYSYLQTGDLPQARGSLVTAKKWAFEQEMPSFDGLSSLIEARAAMPIPPVRGETQTRVRTTVQEVDCGPNGASIIAGRPPVTVRLLLPDPKAIEFVRLGQQPETSSFACGSTKPFQATIDYAPVANMPAGVAGMVRRMEF
jgi:tetratricopeptide (TPR) repeat protein